MVWMGQMESDDVYNESNESLLPVIRRYHQLMSCNDSRSQNITSYILKRKRRRIEQHPITWELVFLKRNQEINILSHFCDCYRERTIQLPVMTVKSRVKQLWEPYKMFNITVAKKRISEWEFPRNRTRSASIFVSREMNRVKAIGVFMTLAMNNTSVSIVFRMESYSRESRKLSTFTSEDSSSRKRADNSVLSYKYSRSWEIETSCSHAFHASSYSR